MAVFFFSRRLPSALGAVVVGIVVVVLRPVGLGLVAVDRGSFVKELLADDGDGRDGWLLGAL